ncbi:MAG TPA: hypothetical protein VGP17_14570 [Solirubrobacteraceae bacterium]|nr:hypothetical protein [Solirubrobacteraceae bacterium]
MLRLTFSLVCIDSYWFLAAMMDSVKNAAALSSPIIGSLTLTSCAPAWRTASRVCQ